MNQANKAGVTPLLLAAIDGSERGRQAAAVLLSRGADAHQPSIGGFSVVHLASLATSKRL